MYNYKAKVIRVIDGDSVWLAVDVGFRVTYKDNFRLARINTPELRSSDEQEKEKAYAAKARMEELLPVDQEVEIETGKAGKYGRWITEIFVRDSLGNYVNINNLLLEEGHAVPY